jgi:predicted DNA-binding transcriptional regulator AlpA
VPAPADQPDRLINAARLKELLGGVSGSTIERRLRDRDLGFPLPRVIGRLRYWSLREVEAWRAAQPVWEERAEPKPMPMPPRRAAKVGG